MGQTSVADAKGKTPRAYVEKDTFDVAADPVVQYMTKGTTAKEYFKS